MAKKQITLTKGATVQQVFATQMDPDSFTRVVTFILLQEDNQQKVMTWKKSKLESITDEYEFMEKLPNMLPRFMRK